MRRQVDPEVLKDLRGKRSREVIAHALRTKGHATDAKAIWRWENGRNQPSASVLPDYATVLGADDVRDLYGDPDDEDESLSFGAALDLMFDRAVDRAVERRLRKVGR